MRTLCERGSKIPVGVVNEGRTGKRYPESKVGGTLELSKRARRIASQPMFRILLEAEKFERAGAKVIHLEIGDTRGFTNDRLIELLQAECKSPFLGYSPSAGETELRQAIADVFSQEKGVQFDVDCVAISSANALISQVLTVVCDEGDGILIPDPGFPTYRLAADFIGAHAIYYELCEEHRWNPSVSSVIEQFSKTPRIKAIVINTPSNPLGVVLDASCIDEIARNAAERGIACVFDETYKNLIYGDDPRRPAHRENNIYIYSFSKDTAAPGLRMGCVVAPAEVIGKITDFNSMFFSCHPGILQRTVRRYIERGHFFYEHIRNVVRARIEIVDSILKQCPLISYVVPNSALYIYLNIGRLGVDAEQFAANLLQECHLCVCPGNGFGPSGHRYIRLTVSGDENELYTGCRILIDYVKEKFGESA